MVSPNPSESPTREAPPSARNAAPWRIMTDRAVMGVVLYGCLVPLLGLTALILLVSLAVLLIQG